MRGFYERLSGFCRRHVASDVREQIVRMSNLEDPLLGDTNNVRVLDDTYARGFEEARLVVANSLEDDDDITEVKQVVQLEVKEEEVEVESLYEEEIELEIKTEVPSFLRGGKRFR